MDFSKIVFIALSMLLANSNSNAQDLSAHQWKNRLVLIVADDPAEAACRQQLAEFRSGKEGLEERKILIYQIRPGQYRTGLSGENGWQTSMHLYNKFRKPNTPFEVFLIGLDGGVKLREARVLSCPELFAVIDGMPMRRAEMREKGKGR